MISKWSLIKKSEQKLATMYSNYTYKEVHLFKYLFCCVCVCVCVQGASVESFIALFKFCEQANNFNITGLRK